MSNNPPLSPAQQTGILLVNLGTPDSPSVPDVRKYLRQFLMDWRVIDVPAIPRWILVNGIIAPFRAPKSAKVYRNVWLPNGSPLMVYTQSFKNKLAKALGPEYVVELGMRYQSPSIEQALENYKNKGFERIVVVPLFPQYASATTGSVHDKVMHLILDWQIIPEMVMVHQFFANEGFLNAVADVWADYFGHKHQISLPTDQYWQYQTDHPVELKAEKHLAESHDSHTDKTHASTPAAPEKSGHGTTHHHPDAIGNYQHVLFSYHGLPERHIRKGDCSGGKCLSAVCCDTLRPDNRSCYRAQCFATTRLLAKKLGLPYGSYTTCFQSRLGNDPWIKPYTDDILKELPKKGIHRVIALSPSFVSDCLETIEEIGMEYKEKFELAGGHVWDLMPCVNDHDSWIKGMAELLKTYQPKSFLVQV